ncbi:MAG: hypothetical protein H8E86_05385, partial [Planctomycetes bacterium]|nr:hypothetical protein [Planctomycetota bacterium]
MISSSVSAFDTVSDWLQEMGCDDLLLSYLEEKIATGSREESYKASNELAIVYKRFLSLDKYRGDQELLKRASELLKGSAQAGTNSLKVQLLRARYLVVEQILENYRLRYASREEADEAILQLKEINEDLSTIHAKVLAKVKRSSARTEDYDLIGMTTSLLAWSSYYVAWYDSDTNAADTAQNFFALMIQAESPTFQQVSFDLKTKEYGARAILGITLCKAILLDKTVTAPWYEALLQEDTYESIRLQIPVWKFFQDIDTHDWQSVSLKLNRTTKDKLLFARLAAVHALENKHEKGATDLAIQAVTLLTELGQLAMLSEIVKEYGTDSLPEQGFISNYIQGDLAFRELSEKVDTSKPSTEPNIIEKFVDIAKFFYAAIAATDANEFQPYLHDCYFMLGLSLFQASEYEKASLAFQTASSMQNDEESLWMSIVALDYLPSQNNHFDEVKNKLVDTFRKQWPDSPRSAQLLVRDASTAKTSSELVSDLLAVTKDDTLYEDSQKQAIAHLYTLWIDAQATQIFDFGNTYIRVALPLLITKMESFDSGDTSHSESAAVLSLRILEIALHQQINRPSAAQRALDALESIEKNGNFSLIAFDKEITYRTILLALANMETQKAYQLLESFLTTFPKDAWTLHGAKSLWRYWDLHQVDIEPFKRFIVGSRILSDISDTNIVQEATLPVSIGTAEAGLQLLKANESLDAAEAVEALRIARLLHQAYPKTHRILHLNASL